MKPFAAGRFPMCLAFPNSEYYQPVRLPHKHHCLLAIYTCWQLRFLSTHAGLPRSHIIFNAHAVGSNPGDLCTTHQDAVFMLSSPCSHMGQRSHESAISGLNSLHLCYGLCTALSTLHDVCSLSPGPPIAHDSIPSCWLSFAGTIISDR
jgi:hypothetical protein